MLLFQTQKEQKGTLKAICRNTFTAPTQHLVCVFNHVCISEETSIIEERIEEGDKNPTCITFIQRRYISPVKSE